MKFLRDIFEPEVPEDIGEIHLAWEFPSVAHRELSRLWYFVVVIAYLGLITYSVMSANFLFAIILVLFGFIIIFQHFQGIRRVPFIMAEDGIIVDNAFYPYRQFKSFSLVYDPPHSKYLYLNWRREGDHSLPIPLEDINPLKVREYLLAYMDEDFGRESEDLSEVLAGLLRLR